MPTRPALLTFVLVMTMVAGLHLPGIPAAEAGNEALDAALARAAENERPVLLEFFTDWCRYCKVFAKETKVRWRCRVCGFTHEGEKAVQTCPVCKHPQAYFEVAGDNF